MAKHRLKEGTLLCIDLEDGTVAFARVLGNSQAAFYSQHAKLGDETDCSSVYESTILFIVTVMKSAFTLERWKAVDHRPLEADLAQPRDYFLKDKMTGRYSIYRSSDGSMRDSTYDECKNLEAAAVWEPEHIEDRLRDHFANRPNVWLEQLKAT